MEWTIYSIGSAAYLEEILNAVAMIHGSGDIESLAKIGLGIGALILAMSAVFNNTGIQFQKLLVCFIMYLAMYGPTGTALIEDVYTKEVAVVDNVPFGPLAVGSILSNIGYSITETFETAFSTPAMTSYGFADPLTALVKVRMAAYNVISLQSFTGAGTQSSLLSSWSNYIKECTLVAANNDERTILAMMANPDAVNAMFFESSVYYTKIFNGPADGTTMSCTEAFIALKAMTDDSNDALLDDLSRKFATGNKQSTGLEVESRLNDALFAVAGGVVDARNFAVMSAILPILESAPGERAVMDMQGASAIMMNQAMQQQNTQWAAEGSMFTKYIRPFMTFFEGFIYAITPLMAFVVVLGGFGISLVTKYLLILIWMMLWMPVLAIVNLYTISTTKSKIEAITGSTSFGSDGLSFNTMRDMLPIIEAQLGVAGLMASSVPALCMFLVFGTSVAASGIASRLNGNDTINEKISSPDVVAPGAGLSMSSAVTHDPTRGARGTGSEELRPTINTGTGLDKAVQSTSENLQASSQAYNHAFQNQLGQSISSGASKGQTAEMGQSFANATGLSQNSAYKSAVQRAYALGATEQDVNSFVAQNAAGVEASAGVSTPLFGAAAKTSSGMTSSGQQSGTSSVQRQQQEAVAAELGSMVQNQFSAQNTTGTAEKLATSQDFKKDAAFTDALSKQTADLNQSKEAYTSTQAFKNSYGMQSSTSIDALAQKALNNGTAGQLVGSLDKLDEGQREDAYQRYESFTKANSTTMGNDAAQVGGAIYALAGTGNYAQLGSALGLDTPAIDPHANAGLGKVGNNGNEAAFNERPVPQPTFDAGAERERINTAGMGSVENARAAGTGQVNSDFGKSTTEMADYRAQEARLQLAESGSGLSYMGIMGSKENMAAVGANAASYTLSTPAELDEKYNEHYARATDHGLPAPLANVAAAAQTNQFTPQMMEDTVQELQTPQYGLSRDEAVGAVGAAVTGSLSSNAEGGSHYANIQSIYAGDNMHDTLTEGHIR